MHISFLPNRIHNKFDFDGERLWRQGNAANWKLGTSLTWSAQNFSLYYRTMRLHCATEMVSAHVSQCEPGGCIRPFGKSDSVSDLGSAPAVQRRPEWVELVFDILILRCLISSDLISPNPTSQNPVSPTSMCSHVRSSWIPMSARGVSSSLGPYSVVHKPFICSCYRCYHFNFFLIFLPCIVFKSSQGGDSLVTTLQQQSKVWGKKKTKKKTLPDAIAVTS